MLSISILEINKIECAEDLHNQRVRQKDKKRNLKTEYQHNPEKVLLVSHIPHLFLRFNCLLIRLLPFRFELTFVSY